MPDTTSETAPAPRPLDHETEVWLRGLAALCDRIYAECGLAQYEAPRCHRCHAADDLAYAGGMWLCDECAGLPDVAAPAARENVRVA